MAEGLRQRVNGVVLDLQFNQFGKIRYLAGYVGESVVVQREISQHCEITDLPDLRNKIK